MNYEDYQWKDVVGYEQYFQVSSCGQIWSKKKNKILKQALGRIGYYTLATRIEGRNSKCVCFRVHRLVAECWLPPPSDNLLEWAKTTKYKKVFVNHKDGNKLNNHYTNLEWCDAKHNYTHAVNLGLINEETNALRNKKSIENRKLTNEQVLYIRENYKPRDKQFGSRALSRMYNIPHTKILDIINNLAYKDVK